MHCEQRYSPGKALALLILGALVSMLLSCNGDNFEIPAPQEFSKANREKLGDLIREAILEHNGFQILPNQPPYDTTVYWYVQSLYDQVTFAMHLDNQSPSDDRWDRNRPWKVHIISDDDLTLAFGIPGGDFFISTGFLKLLKNDYELYYLLAFEGVLMNDWHLLTRLIEEYNSLTLLNIIHGKAPANDISLKIIAEELPDLVFESGVVREVDSETVFTICESSVFERTGIVFLLDNFNEDEIQWLKTRQTYDKRAELIHQISIENGLDCGAVTNTGKYERYVLDFLP